jgi:hypothetical protein
VQSSNSGADPLESADHRCVKATNIHVEQGIAGMQHSLMCIGALQAKACSVDEDRLCNTPACVRIPPVQTLAFVLDALCSLCMQP